MKFALFIVTSTLLISCAKEKTPDPYAGDYDCQVQKKEVVAGSAAVYTNYTEVLTVTKQNQDYDVMGFRIHEDSVVHGKTFNFGAGSNGMSVRFEPDSIYVLKRVGSLGTWDEYEYKGRRTGL